MKRALLVLLIALAPVLSWADFQLGGIGLYNGNVAALGSTPVSNDFTFGLETRLKFLSVLQVGLTGLYYLPSSPASPSYIQALTDVAALPGHFHPASRGGDRSRLLHSNERSGRQRKLRGQFEALCGHQHRARLRRGRGFLSRSVHRGPPEHPDDDAVGRPHGADTPVLTGRCSVAAAAFRQNVSAVPCSCAP